MAAGTFVPVTGMRRQGRKSFLYHGEILPSGMPRNDILFADGDFPPERQLREKIAAQYGFDPDAYLVLFAPTWRRGTQRTEQLDAERLKEAVRERFGKSAVILGRGHHTESKMLEQNEVDVTDYPDMQELLVVIDLLITDYSSSMWDFFFTGKPCLLFTPDLDTYQENPGFDCEIDTWGFPVCETNQLLMEAIMSFDQSNFLLKMKKHHEVLGAYENGHATEFVCEYITNWVKGLRKETRGGYRLNYSEVFCPSYFTFIQINVAAIDCLFQVEAA